jgi:hypothetical protein
MTSAEEVGRQQLNKLQAIIVFWQ